MSWCGNDRGASVPRENTHEISCVRSDELGRWQLLASISKDAGDAELKNVFKQEKKSERKPWKLTKLGNTYT